MACAMFSSDKDRKGMLVTKPFTCWTKATSVVDGHAKKSYHMDSVQKDGRLHCGNREARENDTSPS